MTANLKPCPFCGKNDTEIQTKIDYPECEHIEYYFVECQDCGGRLWETLSEKAEAIEAWNHRPFEDHAVEVLAKNIGFLRYCKGNLWIYGDKVTLQEFLSDWVNYDDDDDWGEFKKDMRKEARALLGWEE